MSIFAVFPLSTCQADTSASVSVSGVQPDTEATFSGTSSPGAFITVLDSVSVVGTTSAGPDGSFSKTLVGQTPGAHTFGLQATDSHGVTTSQTSFLVNLQANAETVLSNIVIPTTISQLTGPRPAVEGAAGPGQTITLFIDPEGTTETFTAGPDGEWSHVLTTPLPAGPHDVYAIASTPSGHLSTASATIHFDITCLAADYNCSGRVDIVDFSVLMYYWGSSDPTADLNGDHIIDLTDFSILMYYWSG